MSPSVAGPRMAVWSWDRPTVRVDLTVGGWSDTDTRSKDGPTNYQKAAYKVGHRPYSVYTLDKGRSSTTSGGSTILGFNATLSTGLSTNRKQTIHMGSRTSRLHWVFASANL